MNFNDVLTEARNEGIQIKYRYEERKKYIEFNKGPSFATMKKMDGNKWEGIKWSGRNWKPGNIENNRIIDHKAQVAKWCMDSVNE